MLSKIQQTWANLAEQDGFTVEKSDNPKDTKNSYQILTGDAAFPLSHPVLVHLRLYRGSADPAIKFQHMKSVHHYFWPHHIKTWNYWEERRFQAHCGDYQHIVLAGGAGCGKSIDAAKIALIFWLSNPKHNSCIISSTTLESLETRIWGYAAKLLKECEIKFPVKLLEGKPPKIRHIHAGDKIHGMFAVAIREGQNERTLSTIIGRHPDKEIMVILDEATDITASILDSRANLEQGVEKFQLWAIGNSNDKNNLHGALSTPKNGWDSIDPMRDYIWETTHTKGVCLYFNPHDSPAIHEKDPVKKEALGKFLITEEKIKEAEASYGKESNSFQRFVLGFWPKESYENIAFSEQFVSEHEVWKGAEWSGFYPLDIVAGLDPAYSVGSQGCVLRFAILGQTTNGLIALDFRKEELLFRLEILNTGDKSAELQLAEQIASRLQEYNCSLSAMAIDATGPGRALGEIVRLVMGVSDQPIKIISTGGFAQGNQIQQRKNDPGVYSAPPSVLWFKLKEFIQHNQVRGLDQTTIFQLTRRLVFSKNNKLVLEPKTDFKSRMSAVNSKLGRSPDEADAAILTLHAAMIRFGLNPGQIRDLPREKPKMEMDFFMQKHQAQKRLEEGVRGELPLFRRVPLMPNFDSE